jgi:hypothetical protein
VLQTVPFAEPCNDREPPATPSLTRQIWLEHAVGALRTKFAEVGFDVPSEVRVSIGFCKRTAGCGADGQCWSTEASSDRHFEVFVSPELKNDAEIVGVLAHELVHATVGTQAGHGAAFKRCALRVGLIGSMTATTAGPELAGWIQELFTRIGRYPAGFVTVSPRQTTRQLKCVCVVCGYTARISRKWLAVGTPICPVDRVSMVETTQSDAAEESQ